MYLFIYQTIHTLCNIRDSDYVLCIGSVKSDVVMILNFSTIHLQG